jgi:tRNA(Ile)-lysidine synthase
MEDKENQWLLCSEDQIVWVIGKRADERFIVKETTKNSIKIELN